MSKLLNRLRMPLLAMALMTLVGAMWAGLLRMGWNWPVLQSDLPLAHGPLMVCGFLGTVIGIERAVALSAEAIPGPRRYWSYLGPLLTGIGAVLLLLGVSSGMGAMLLTLGSLNLVAVFGLILRTHLATFTVTMALGALLWLIGNSLWLFGWPVYAVVPWWSGFLILTIAGERLELGRILRLSTRVQAVFKAIVALILLGLITTLFDFASGVRLSSGGLVLLSGWLFIYDIARYTVRKTGLTRFIAVCLLLGYGWLGIGGLLGLYYGGVSAGFAYDAIQHAIFVGFVMSMIFGHAPIIFPAVLEKAMPFHAYFYSHLILLHLSLLLRLYGDLAIWLPARQWGGLLNAIAILLFMANTVRAIATARSATLSTPTTLQEIG